LIHHGGSDFELTVVSLGEIEGVEVEGIQLTLKVDDAVITEPKEWKSLAEILEKTEARPVVLNCQLYDYLLRGFSSDPIAVDYLNPPRMLLAFSSLLMAKKALETNEILRPAAPDGK